MTIQKKLGMILVLLCTHIYLFSQEAFSLDQAVQYALNNHNEVKKSLIAVEDAIYTSKEYKAIGMPKLNGKIDYNYFIKIPTQILPDFLSPVVDGKLLGYGLIQPNQLPPPTNAGFPAQFGTKNNLTAGLELGALLFDGQFFVGLEAQRLLKELYVKQKDITNYQVKNNVIKAYLSILIAEKNKSLLLKNIANVETTLKEIKAINKAGFVEQLDVDRLELTLQNVRTELDKVDNLIELTKNLLKFQMGYPQEDPIQLTEDLDMLVNRMKVDKSELDQNLSIQNRPEYPVMQTGLRLLDMKLKAIKAGYLPTVVGFGSYSYSLQRTNLFDKNDNKAFPTGVIGLNVNVPIFDGFDKSSKMQRTKLEISKAKLNISDFERGITLETQNAKTAMKNAFKSLENAERSLTLAQRIYDITQKKYKAGVGTSLEIVQAERDLYSAQSGEINALFGLISAKVDLDKALGK